MHTQILDLISWHRVMNLFRTLIFLTIINKSMQMLVPKPTYNRKQWLSKSFSECVVECIIRNQFIIVYKKS
jgi:hypothetical protein